ncbi:uncharacterized protein N7459_005916 [Penicillium hispanicum]|uniref:uncharacterized protein n=1 Tax=Penicillium hispanicum TaxID=1080232 RepID=UPI0025418460|nr:uncharacterized protein N7459_005916 [Penicillium hispanicum]KAJ5579931.1 hypothetical protein N7459_005916 [Penicillium hispanicum]
MEIIIEPTVSRDEPLQQVKDSQRSSGRMSWIQYFFFRTRLDDNVCNQNYTGQGTDDDPYIVDYLHNDHHDAMNFSYGRKWAIAIFQSLSTFVVTFSSSVYASGIGGIEQRFNVSAEVATLGLSLYVLGFAVGPLIWAPLSEIYGRKSVYVISFMSYTAFSVAAACSPNITALLILRFFASAFGSSSMTNTGGVIADMFNKTQRGLATGLFVTAPFLGPALGPIAGGFLAETQGWRWPLGLIAIMGGVVWIITMLITLETYAPFILRRRANALSQMTGSIYVPRISAGAPRKTFWQELSVSFTRPWIFLFREPIVLLTSLYVSIIYGTLYMFFAGFPIVFQYTRGWSQGIAGLPFIGVAIGVCLATLAAGVDNKRYVRLSAEAEAAGGTVEPEARLSTAMVGSLLIPIGLFLFAWTTYPSVHWIVPIIGAVFFSCGLVMVFISLMSYLVDSYTVYAASVLAANSMLRSLFGTAFPLFTTQMYENLGNQWASSVPAFLVLVCVPFPFLFHKYGSQIRSKCKYSLEAANLLDTMRRRQGAMIGVRKARTRDAFIKAYFDHVYPFAPVINRVDFIRGYQSGDCSLFLLFVMLAPATVHAPADVLSACGFASRSAAQEMFFSKAKLLHDFAAEDDPLVMLQGSIILCMVILDHPSDRDFGYWFHNAIRLATKLDIRNAQTPYSLEVVQKDLVGSLQAEDISEASSDLLSPVTPQQRALPVVHCELSRIFGQCLSNMTNKPPQDPRQMLQPLDTWRKCLATKMHVGGNIGTDVYYLTIQAMSYRFECILCRLMRRCWQQSQPADWSKWPKQRLRTAILELDTITKRVLASGNLQDFPISFITTITALLALHIESALDPAETDLARSMARISISQTMLVLTQGKEIPALKRALPLFEEILARKSLCLVPPNSLGQGHIQSQSQDNNMADAYASPHTEVSVVPSQLEQCENYPSFYEDFLGFDLLDEWQIGQLDFTGQS